MTPRDEFGGRVRHIEQPMIDRYAQASGDLNPIHLDSAFAAATPFGGVIAHGMLLVGYVGELLADRFGPSWTRGGALKVRFRTPARPGDWVTTRGRIERVEGDEPSARRVVCTIECVNQNDEVLVSGEARVHGTEEELTL